MTYIRKLILALVLSAGLAPAFAQVPPPVPALPDTERRTTYSISASTCACNVNFALYGDSTDYANWIEVFVNGVRMTQAGNWTLSSVTGTIGSIPLPITNAVLTFTAPQTGTIQIVGARRPRRTSQFNEGAGVPTRNFNVVLSDLTAQNRELWDKTNDVTGRALLSQPGNTISMLPLPSVCAGKFLGFDATGLITQCSSGGAGSGNVVGPVSSTVGHFATWNNLTGTLLADHVIGLPDLPADAGTWRTATTTDTVLTTDCWKTIGLGGSALFSETLPVVASFPAGCRVKIKNTDVYTGAGTGRGKQLIGFPSDLYATLYPQQILEVQIVNGAWVATLNPGRWINPQQVTICVDLTGSDTTGDGLAVSGAGCLRHLVKANSVVYNQLDTQNQMPIMNVTGGGTFNEQVFAGSQITGVNVYQIQSTGGAFTWANAALCVDLGDNAEIVFQGPINWACNTGNSAGQAAIYGHNNAIFDLVGTHAATGGGANDSFIFCDGPCVISTTNGFTLAGTFGDAVHFDAGGKGSFSGTIAPVSSPTVGRLFNLRYSATAIMGAAPTGAGYASLGPSLVSTGSTLQTNGLTIPGGAIVPTTGGQVCTTLTACFGSPGTVTNDNATAGYPGEYISTGSANSTATITVTIATPAVVTWTAHGFVNSPIDGNTCTPINFTTTGALPTGIVAGSTYYVIPSSITTNTFQIANSVANCLVGTTVNTSGSQSGVQTGINNASIATGVAKDITGLSLTAGDWDVCGLVSSNVAGGTVISLFYGYLTTVSGTNAAVPNNGAVTVFQTAITAGGNVAMPIGCKRYSLASTTTIYLGTLMNFSSTNAAYGFIRARRIR